MSGKSSTEKPIKPEDVAPNAKRGDESGDPYDRRNIEDVRTNHVTDGEPRIASERRIHGHNELRH